MTADFAAQSADIRTIDSSRTRATAPAVKDEISIGVGSVDEIRDSCDASIVVRDRTAWVIIPGLTDGHRTPFAERKSARAWTSIKAVRAIGGSCVCPIDKTIVTFPFNILSRCPVLAGPSGRASAGVPTGIQIVGSTYDDTTVFRVSAPLEQSRPCGYRVVVGGPGDDDESAAIR